MTHPDLLTHLTHNPLSALISGEMVGPAARPETEIEISLDMEMLSTLTAAPSLAASVGGSVGPSAFTGDMEIPSGYPLPARRKAVTAAP